MFPVWFPRQETRSDIRCATYLTGPWQWVVAIHLRLGLFRWNPEARKDGRLVKEWRGFRLSVGVGRVFRGEVQ